MKEDFEHIIYDGTLAPSGENCQPWRFEITGTTIKIYNVPKADASIYNFKQKGSYVSHGAVIENIVISARKYGYKAAADIFPKNGKENLVSVITLEHDGIKDEGLHSYISDRCTNRKDHSPKKLSSEQKELLVQAARETGGTFTIIDDAEKMKMLGKALAINEQIIFENKELHDFFYEHILWNKEDQKKAGGFYIKTLEFLPHQLKGVKLFKSWTVLKLLNRLARVSEKIVKENAGKYASSGALAIFTMDENSDKAYVEAGRAMEKIWLEATKLGLSVHPCTGVIYFMKNIEEGNADVFSKEHQEVIKKAYRDIMETFGARGKTAPFLLRLGFAEEPTSRALRLEPNITYTT